MPQSSAPSIGPPRPSKLLDQMADQIRVRHLALSTERSYLGWVRRFILFHNKRHPKEMGVPEVTEFLTHLAVEGHVSASTPFLLIHEFYPDNGGFNPPGITWTSQSAYSVYGWTNGYGFGGNGGWNSPLSMIGSNSGTDTMRIDFASPVSAVAAFMNYAPGYGTPTMAVYNNQNSLLESYVLNFATGGGSNNGEVHGFQESIANIAYMTLSGAYIGAAHLQVLAGSVPEPTSYALVAIALAAAAAAARRRRPALLGRAQVG